MMEVKHLNNDNYEEINSCEFALVDFYASWCAPCRALAPIIEDVARELKDKCFVFKADVDELEEQSATLHIMSIPTVILFKNGQEVLRINGLRPKEYILEQVNSVIGK